MRKSKIVMPIAAFVFAVAFSFASVKIAEAPEPGTFIQNSNPEECESVNVICEGQGEICTYLGQDVYGQRDGTTCSILLEKNPE